MPVLGGRQGFFLGVTFVLTVVLVWLSQDLTTAVLLISLVTNYLITSSQLNIISSGSIMPAGSVTANSVPDAVALGVSSGFCSRPRPEEAEILSDLAAQVETPIQAGGLGAEQYGSLRSNNGGPLRHNGGGPPQGYKSGAPQGYNGGLDHVFEEGGLPLQIRADPGGPVYPPRREGLPQVRDTPYNPTLVRRDAPRGDYRTIPGSVRMTHDADHKIAAFQLRHAGADPYRAKTGTVRRKALLAPHVHDELRDHENRDWWGNSDLLMERDLTLTATALDTALDAAGFGAVGAPSLAALAGGGAALAPSASWFT